MSRDTGTPGGSSPPEPPRKPDRKWLGDSLRALLKGYAEEPLPDEFRALLDKLDTGSVSTKSPAGTDSEGETDGKEGGGEGGVP